jgi:hypothetical protein
VDILEYDNILEYDIKKCPHFNSHNDKSKLICPMIIKNVDKLLFSDNMTNDIATNFYNDICGYTHTTQYLHYYAYTCLYNNLNMFDIVVRDLIKKKFYPTQPFMKFISTYRHKFSDLIIYIVNNIDLLDKNNKHILLNILYIIWNIHNKDEKYKILQQQRDIEETIYTIFFEKYEISELINNGIYELFGMTSDIIIMLINSCLSNGMIDNINNKCLKYCAKSLPKTKINFYKLIECGTEVDIDIFNTICKYCDFNTIIEILNDNRLTPNIESIINVKNQKFFGKEALMNYKYPQSLPHNKFIMDDLLRIFMENGLHITNDILEYTIKNGIVIPGGINNIVGDDKILELCKIHKFFKNCLFDGITHEQLMLYDMCCRQSCHKILLQHMNMYNVKPDTYCIEVASNFKNNLKCVEILINGGAKVTINCLERCFMHQNNATTSQYAFLCFKEDYDNGKFNIPEVINDYAIKKLNGITNYRSYSVIENILKTENITPTRDFIVKCSNFLNNAPTLKILRNRGGEFTFECVVKSVQNLKNSCTIKALVEQYYKQILGKDDNKDNKEDNKEDNDKEDNKEDNDKNEDKDEDEDDNKENEEVCVLEFDIKNVKLNLDTIDDKINFINMRKKIIQEIIDNKWYNEYDQTLIMFPDDILKNMGINNKGYIKFEDIDYVV